MPTLDTLQDGLHDWQIYSCNPRNPYTHNVSLLLSLSLSLGLTRKYDELIIFIIYSMPTLDTLQDGLHEGQIYV